jgi:uncharacterized metal-binding protein YceD (DUF177 family)
MMRMKDLKIYDIKFSGLKNGNHQLKFHLEHEFFRHFNYDEFDKHNLDILIDFNKTETMLEFTVKSNGTIRLICDISGEAYDQQINGQIDFLIKFGETFNDDREDLIILPYHSHTFNIAQQIYETVLLSIPQKRIHPDIESGKMKTENIKYIINYQDKPETENKEIDPRWAVLKKILTDKKQ